MIRSATTTLADDLVPDELCAIVAAPAAGSAAPALRRSALHRPRSQLLLATASPRSSTWPAPRPPGGCGPPGSWAAVRRRRAGAAWPSGQVPSGRPGPPRGARPAGEHGQLDWSWASVDTMSVRAKRGGPGARSTTCRRSIRRRGGGAPDQQPRQPAPTCGGVGSPRGSPAVGSSPRPGWVGIADGWSGCCQVDLPAAAAGPVGLRFGAVVRVRAAGLCGRLLQPTVTGQRERV
jgi:hypothetical protein